MQAIQLFQKWVLAVCIISFSACFTTSRYDQQAYAQTTSLKVDAMNLMDKAVEPYQNHIPAINTFTEKADKVYEYELHRKNNDFSIKLWNVIRDPNNNLMGGFLKRWKEKGQLSETFIGEAKKQVATAFDQVAELESGKIKASDVKQ